MLEASTMSSEKPAHILVVDDEPFVRNAIQLYLETQGFRVSTAESGERALEILARTGDAVDLLLLDLVMPGIHGLEVLKRVKEIDRSIEVVIATGCGTVHSAIEAMRFGAFDYITKPVVDFEKDLLKTVRAAVRARRERQAGAAGDRSSFSSSRYRDDLEELATRLLFEAGALQAAPRGKDFATGFLEFSAKHLRADSVLAIEETDGEAPRLAGAWGSARGAPPGEVEAALALLVARAGAHGSWETLSAVPAAALLSPGARGIKETCDLEVLRIPVLARSPRAGGEPISLFLFVRAPLRSAPAEEGAPALLSLVLGAALDAGSLRAPLSAPLPFPAASLLR
jgi:DNA-binding response OmpR family regulator